MDTCSSVSEGNITFRSHHGNCYIYSIKQKSIWLTTPEFYNFLQCCQSKLKSRSPKDLLYKRRYEFLKKSDYFASIDPSTYLSKRITTQDVEQVLCNPHQIVFEVTGACNLKCEYCVYGKFYSRDEPISGFMESDRAIALIKHLEKYWTRPTRSFDYRRIFIGFYGGEPLLNIKFIRDIVKFLNTRKGIQFKFLYTMTTNGTLLYKHMDFLVENDFSLLISLDGNEQNNSYRVDSRGVASYSDVCSNIRALKKKYPKYYRNRVSFNAVFHNRNSLEDIHKFFSREFGKYPKVSQLNDSGVLESQKNEFRRIFANVADALTNSPSCEQLENDLFINLPSILAIGNFIEVFSRCFIPDYRDLFNSKNVSLGKPSGTCIPFSRKIYMTVNGNLMPCERISREYCYGHVNHSAINIDPKAIADKFNAYLDRISLICRQCARFNFCGVCMYYQSLSNETVECDHYIDYAQLSDYLSAHISYLEEKKHILSRIIKEVTFE